MLNYPIPDMCGFPIDQMGLLNTTISPKDTGIGSGEEVNNLSLVSDSGVNIAAAAANFQNFPMNFNQNPHLSAMLHQPMTFPPGGIPPPQNDLYSQMLQDPKMQNNFQVPASQFNYAYPGYDASMYNYPASTTGNFQQAQVPQGQAGESYQQAGNPQNEWTPQVQS